MEIIFLLIMFAMGTVFGSFFTLAVYRIPLKKDITHERSFCPKCNHRLEFLDLIPVLSYIFLKGKCRYCGEKIRIRYLLLEILSGLVFVVAYFSMNFDFPFYTIEGLISLVSFIMFYTTVVLVSGIDKEYRTISKRVLIFGVISQGLYLIYLAITKNISLLNFSILLGIFILTSLFDRLIKIKNQKKNYLVELIVFYVYLNMYLDISLVLFTLLITAIFIMISKIINFVISNANLKSLESDSKTVKNCIGFYLGISSIIIALVQNFTCYWR